MRLSSLGLGIVAALAASAFSARPAAAGEVTYSLLDIGTFTGYTTPNVGQSHSGSGFVGYYSAESGSPDTFVHLFGVESIDYSRVGLEQDISALHGKTINSATLWFLF